MDEHIQVGRYIGGSISPEERADWQEHLERCVRCRAALRIAKKASGEDGRQAYSLLQFAYRMLQAGAALVAPPIRQLQPRLSTPEIKQKQAAPFFEPLRVLQPHVASGTRRLVGLIGSFGLVLGLTIGVLLIPTPEGLSPEGHRALAVLVFTGSVLALEPVSLPIAALMVPVAQVALGIGTTTEVFGTFSRPVVFLILAGLFIAEALRKHGLTRRVALATILTSGGGIPMLLLGLMGIAAVFSMWVENTATAAVLIPVALTISRQVQDPKEARGLLVLLVLGIAYSASLGGMVTIMGSASNAVASGFLAQIRSWTFLDWMIYGLPAFLLVFPITWWLLIRLVPVAVRNLDMQPVRQRMEALGPMSGYEREVLLTLGVAAFFWITGSFIEPALGLPETLLSAAMVAIIAVAYLAVRNIINWEDVKGVSWGIFLIIGAGLSLGEALTRTGATDWFASIIVPVVKGPPLLVSMLLLVYLSALLTNVMNNTTIAAVFVPVLISLAQADPALNSVQLVLPVTLATTFGYSLPSASGRMSLIAASGLVSKTEMMRYGIILTMVSSGILGTFFYFLALLNWI